MDEKIDQKWGDISPFHDPYALANFVPRTSDVLIATAPKAGTTWMQQILYQLKSGGDETFDSIFDVVPWLEYPLIQGAWRDRLAEFDNIIEPRIFKTHCTYNQTPGVNTVKIILSSRDPRDCCISFYHHLNDLTDEVCELRGIKKPPSFDTYFEDWMADGSWYRNIISWWPHINDDNVLWLRYENMKHNLPACLDELIHFLDWPVTENQKTRILEYSSFNWMKENSDKFTVLSGFEKPIFKPGGFIRKGHIGDYKNKLSKTQALKIIKRARDQLTPACYDFLELD